MSNFFLPLWLPVSIVAHIVLLLVLYFMPLEATQIPGTTRVALAHITANGEIIPVAQKKEPVVLPPPPVEADRPEILGKKPQVRGAINGPEATKRNGYTGNSNPNAHPGPSDRGNGNEGATARKVVNGGNDNAIPRGTNDGQGTGEGDAKNLPGPNSGGGISRGVGVKNIARASYPKNALNESREGTVVVLVSVNAQGEVTGVDISRSSGHSDLDNAAMKAARRSTFEPAMKDGKAADSSRHVTYHFANGSVSAE